jgi:cyanophycinase-like exopeptidase
VFDAKTGGVTSSEALADPASRDVSLVDKFLTMVPMSNVLTDTHFYQRDRMGRLVAFLAKATHAGWGGPRGVLGVAVSEHTAVLVDAASGDATMHGVGPAYFLRATVPPKKLKKGDPLTYGHVGISKWNSSMLSEAAPAAGGVAISRAPAPSFSFASWAGVGLESYFISAVAGVLASTAAGGSIY